MDLKRIVLEKIEELGVKEAAKLYGVSVGTISNWTSGKTDPSVDAVQMSIDESFSIPEKRELDEITMWDGKKVMILLPVYRSFCPDTHFTLFANYAKYGPEKIGMIQEKRTVIHESRNILVHKALKTDAEWFIMVDDDMILPCGVPSLINGRYGAALPEPSAGLTAISRLMSHPSEARIVGALYFGRHRFGKAQCSSGFDNEIENEKLRRHQYSTLLPQRWVGTGCIKYHRSVFEDIKTAIDNGKFPDCKPANETMWYGFFNPIRVAVGEDVSMGLRAGEIGIQSYLDPVLECLHNGEMNYCSSNTKKQP